MHRRRVRQCCAPVPGQNRHVKQMKETLRQPLRGQFLPNGENLGDMNAPGSCNPRGSPCSKTHKYQGISFLQAAFFHLGCTVRQKRRHRGLTSRISRQFLLAGLERLCLQNLSFTKWMRVESQVLVQLKAVEYKEEAHLLIIPAVHLRLGKPESLKLWTLQKKTCRPGRRLGHKRTKHLRSQVRSLFLLLGSRLDASFCCSGQPLKTTTLSLFQQAKEPDTCTVYRHMPRAPTASVPNPSCVSSAIPRAEDPKMLRLVRAASSCGSQLGTGILGLQATSSAWGKGLDAEPQHPVASSCRLHGTKSCSTFFFLHYTGGLGNFVPHSFWPWDVLRYTGKHSEQHVRISKAMPSNSGTSHQQLSPRRREVAAALEPSVPGVC